MGWHGEDNCIICGLPFYGSHGVEAAFCENHYKLYLNYQASYPINITNSNWVEILHGFVIRERVRYFYQYRRRLLYEA